MNPEEPKTKPARGSGRIFQLKNSPRFWWVAYFDGHNREHREVARNLKTGEKLQATEKLHKQAERFLAFRRDQVGADRIGLKTFLGPSADKVTGNQMLDLLQAKYEYKSQLSRVNRSLLKIIRKRFGLLRAKEIDANQLDQYIRELRAEDYQPASINRRLQTLRAAFRLAVKKKLISSDDVPHFELLDESQNVRTGFVSRAELNRLLPVLPDYFKDVTLFAFLSSWRANEILSLVWGDVESDVIRLRAVNSKEREARCLALEGELLDVITRRRALADGPLVFHHGGRRIVDYRKSWKSSTRLAGLPGLRFHDLRRSGVRDMVRAGASIQVAKLISGHKTDSMFARYAIMVEADQRAVLRRTQEFQQAEAAAEIPGSTRIQ